METGAAVRNGCLVVFDIDGTLIDTRQTDTDACFFAVVRAVTGLDGLREDGTSYPGATSAAIFDVIIRKAYGRPSTMEDTAAFQSRLGTAMRARYLDGRRLPPMAGAGELLGRLMAGDAWRVAVATGNWDDEARVKLASARLPLERAPIATSSDHAARKDILALAVGRAKAHYGASLLVCALEGVAGWLLWGGHKSAVDPHSGELARTPVGSVSPAARCGGGAGAEGSRNGARSGGGARGPAASGGRGAAGGRAGSGE
ncbi:MAG: hypothetical protein AAB368_07425, partial [bacterium]